jgi:hypothetical protein
VRPDVVPAASRRTVPHGPGARSPRPPLPSSAQEPLQAEEQAALSDIRWLGISWARPRAPRRPPLLDSVEGGRRHTREGREQGAALLVDIDVEKGDDSPKPSITSERRSYRPDSSATWLIAWLSARFHRACDRGGAAQREPAFNSRDVTFSYPDPLPLAECRRAPGDLPARRLRQSSGVLFPLPPGPGWWTNSSRTWRGG